MPNNEALRGRRLTDSVTLIEGIRAATSTPVVREPGLGGLGGIPSGALQDLLKPSQRRNAEEEIQQKWNSLNGAPGSAKISDDNGLITIEEGYYREYDAGRIYYKRSLAAFWVYGDIGEKYTQLGGPSGWLGWPTSDELPFAQEGRVSTFQKGAIYWWPDTRAIELGNISVRYKGLYCFGETDESSDSDEPYVILGVVPALTEQKFSTRTGIYEKVDAGDSREDSIELYRGLPYGLSLTAVLMEHDYGDPDKFREIVKTAVEKASEGVAAAVGFVPVVGQYLSPLAAAFLKEVGPDIVNAINNLLGTEDDYIGTVSFEVTAKDMVRLTRVQQQNFGGILWHLDSPLISDGEASYKVYIDVQAV